MKVWSNSRGRVCIPQLKQGGFRLGNVDNKKPFLSFIGLMLLLLCGITVANAQSPQQIAKKALASTVLLVMEDANGQPLSLGSGFFIRNGEVATNLHVIKGASRGYAKLVGQKTKYDIEGITAIDAERDLVILKISVPGAQVISLPCDRRN